LYRYRIDSQGHSSVSVCNTSPSRQVKLKGRLLHKKEREVFGLLFQVIPLICVHIIRLLSSLFSIGMLIGLLVAAAHSVHGVLI
jgi:hypothetical protein